jgi:hypothetical protein
MILKKSQISNFIIIGIILLFITTPIIIYKKYQTTDVIVINTEKQVMKTFIKNCLTISSHGALNYLGSNGGYFNSPNLSISYINIKSNVISNISTTTQTRINTIPYYLFNGENHYPDKNLIYKEYNKALNFYYENCVDNFSFFQSKGYQIEYDNLKVNSIISNQSINIIQNNIISFTLKNKNIIIHETNHQLLFNYPRILSIIDEFITEQAKDENYLLIGLIDNLANQYDFNYEMKNMENNDIKLKLIFNNSQSEINYHHSFLIKFNFNSSNITENEET